MVSPLFLYRLKIIRKGKPSWPSGSGLENRGFVKGCVGSSPTLSANMVVLAQLVRASACGAEGHRFEPDIPPKYMVFQALR